jgi:hypothetical protein
MAMRAKPRRAGTRGAHLVAFAVALACSRPPAGPSTLGHRLAEGQVLALRPSPDGAFLAFLDRCQPQKDRTLPPGTASCDLSVVPAAGGERTPVAKGVTTLLPGFAWSGQGHALAGLEGYDHEKGTGTLVVWSSGAPRRLAGEVSFYALSRDGTRVGYAAEGRLFVVAGNEAPAPIAGADGVTSFEFGGPGGHELLARRSARSGGELLAVRGGRVAPLASAVRDYGYARDGARFAFTSGAPLALAILAAGATHAPPALARDVQAFLFSPAGDAIAYVSDAAPGRQGDLWVAPLTGAAPVRLGQRVGEPRWSAQGGRLAWLQDYDPRGRTGSLSVGGVGMKPITVAKNVSDFDLTADGREVAFLHHETSGGYSVDLGLVRLDGATRAEAVAKGVFGFSFSPDARWLYYRTSCVRDGDACDLFRVGAGSDPAKPELVAEGVKSFEFAPGRPERLLVSWARRDRVALDLAVWEAGKFTAIDTHALPGSARFLGGDPGRVAYAVVEAKRQGVYVAALP